MLPLLLTLAALLLSAYVFYVPLPPGQAEWLEILQLLLLGTLFLLLTFRTLRRRAERLAAGRPMAVPVEVPTERRGENGGEAAVVQFLARLQEKGRFVDFLQEEIAAYGNEQVGAAARVVHQGCREVLAEVFDLKPVHAGAEGDEIILGGDYDAARYRLLGNAPDRSPFQGKLRHPGWRTTRVNLPRVGTGAAAREVVAPADVEIA